METYHLFVVTPYNEESKKVWSDALVPAVNRINELKDYTIEPTRADFELKGLQFKHHLDDHLHDADMCLCDITDTNPNVMYEIGYAHAINKETIIITGDDESIPIDVSDQYVYTYENTNLGKLSLYLETAIDKAVLSVIDKRSSAKHKYEVSCFRDRSASDLGKAFVKAEERIDILETNVKTVISTYKNEIKQALKEHTQLHVRILTLDPDSSFVNNRAEQLGVPTGNYREELHEAIRYFLDEFSSFGERVTLRIYDDFPTQITFIADDLVYSCSIARATRSRKLCTFKLHEYDPGVERSFLFHFEAVWGFGRVYVPVKSSNIEAT